MLTHGNLVSNAEALRETWRYTADDVLIHALPIFHTHGLFVATNVTLLLGRLDAVPAEVRRRPDLRADAAGNRADGRPDLLRAPAAGRHAERRDDGAHAALRLRLGAAARRDPPRVEGADRARHPRALRHDRDQHERLEPLRRRARRGHGRPAAARRRDHRHRSGDRGRARAGRDRHDRGARPERVQGLLADAGEDRGRAARQRLLHHRRPRQDRREAATSTSSAAART